MSGLGAVILHYRHWPGVCATIDAVLAEGIDPTQLRVVDNASRDGSIEAIAAHYPQLADSIISLPDNNGYAAGMNVGIESLGRSDTLLLTHEAVLAPGSVQALTQRLVERPRVGMVGPLLVHGDDPDRVYAAGGVFNRRMGIGHLYDGDATALHVDDEPLEVQWLDGACLLVRRAVFDGVGLFDDGFFLYYEETDFAARASRAGWRIECVPRAVVSQRPGRLPRALWVRNRLRFLWRNAPRKWFARQLLVDLRTVIVGPERVETLRGALGYLRGASPQSLYRTG